MSEPKHRPKAERQGEVIRFPAPQPFLHPRAIEALLLVYLRGTHPLERSATAAQVARLPRGA